jgi:Family of unknown function (DUF5670)
MHPVPEQCDISRVFPSSLKKVTVSFGRIVMIWTIIGILFLLWLAGFVFHVAGGLIHILLVVAVVLVIYRLVNGRSAV